VNNMIIAIKMGNSAKFRFFLDQKDRSLVLRDELRGPLSTYQYEFTLPAISISKKQEATAETIVAEFDSLSLAMIADLGQLDLLIALVKHESFVPTQKDFESFVGVCLAKRNHLLLKTFLQAF